MFEIYIIQSQKLLNYDMQHFIHREENDVINNPKKKKILSRIILAPDN